MPSVTQVEIESQRGVYELADFLHERMQAMAVRSDLEYAFAPVRRKDRVL